MVEAQLLEDPVRASTPTQRRYLTQILNHKEPDFEPPPTPQDSPEIYDPKELATPTDVPEELDYSGADIDNSPDSLHGDARGDMSESSMPDHANSGSNRRRSRPQLAPSQRSSAPHLSQPQASNHGYPISSASTTSDNVQTRPPLTGFQGSTLHYSSPNAPYNQRPAFVGQYTMSAQPSPMPMAHSAPPYAFSPYHHPDNNMMPQNIHANYTPLLQPPHAPVFPYQRHSPEGGSSTHASFSAPRYQAQSHQVGPSPSPTSPHLPTSSGSQSRALSTSYLGSGSFPSLRYPSPMSTNPYQYQSQSFSPSPMYQSQYAPPQSFGQHYTPTSETEPQGAWYYLPHHVPSPQQYDSTSSYQGHYPTVGYPGMGHTEVQSGYSTGGQSSTANPSTPSYPLSPTAQAFSQYSEGQVLSADSPHISGGGLPSHNPSPVPNPGSTSSGSGRHADKPVVRRSYHPNPPAHRSEWVMWAGNVPSDATHDELWRFFNHPLENATDDGDTGVLSIFLISRSSCAFVNYRSETFLHGAIQRFNGVPLRPNDPRCARLVCRVRRKDDDLKAGVGGQRGMGMHTKWIKEQKGKQRESASEPSDLSASDDPSSPSPSSISERMAAAISAISISNDERGGDERAKRGVHAKHSSSSGSYASTNSGFLTRNFPKRYFILKSLTQYDLDLSVQRGVWATQKHNEEILDQAFRTSKEVFLIFGVNKSGEFYGYARMTGPVRRGERLSWASRPSLSPASSTQSPLSRRLKSGEAFFSPSDLRLVDGSPLPVDDAPHNVSHSAPALMGVGYHLPTLLTPAAKHSLDQRIKSSAKARQEDDDFELDSNAPLRAMKHPESAGGSIEKIAARSAPRLQSVEEVEEKEVTPAARDLGHEPVGLRGEESWGECFAIQWLSTERLPFHRTRHLRNPWNHDREVKVSRDGTELEPSVGERLLEEWERLADPQAPMPSARAGGKRPAGPKTPGPSGGLEAPSKGEEDTEGTRGGPSRS